MDAHELEMRALRDGFSPAEARDLAEDAVLVGEGRWRELRERNDLAYARRALERRQLVDQVRAVERHTRERLHPVPRWDANGLPMNDLAVQESAREVAELRADFEARLAVAEAEFQAEQQRQDDEDDARAAIERFNRRQRRLEYR